MKEIKRYDSPKYQDASRYKLFQDGIYETTDQYNKTVYVTSISFIQEPEYGEGPNASRISQYPTEDILDSFKCYISDNYEDLNVESSNVCYLEFGAEYPQCIEEILNLTGKHVYNKQDGKQVFLYADGEKVIPLKEAPKKLQLVRKEGTPLEKTTDVMALVLGISMLLLLIGIIVEIATDNYILVLVATVLFWISVISFIILDKIKKKNENKTRTNQTPPPPPAVVENPQTKFQMIREEPQPETTPGVEELLEETQPETTPVIAEIQVEEKPLEGDHQEGIERKEKNEKYISSLGIKINTHLPIVPEKDEAQLKDLDTISKRAIASLISIQLSCDLRDGRNDSLELCQKLLEKYNVTDSLNDKEKRLYDGTYSNQDLIDIDWEYECYWSLVWALGLVNDIKDASIICDCDQAVHFVLSAKNLDEFKANCHIRPINEILDMLDLYYRYHWAVVENRIRPETNIGNLDTSVVQERRRGLEWLISEEQDWFDISLDT